MCCGATVVHLVCRRSCTGADGSCAESRGSAAKEGYAASAEGYCRPGADPVQSPSLPRDSRARGHVCGLPTPNLYRPDGRARVRSLVGAGILHCPVELLCKRYPEPCLAEYLLTQTSCVRTVSHFATLPTNGRHRPPPGASGRGAQRHAVHHHHSPQVRPGGHTVPNRDRSTTLPNLRKGLPRTANCSLYSCSCAFPLSFTDKPLVEQHPDPLAPCPLLAPYTLHPMPPALSWTPPTSSWGVWWRVRSCWPASRRCPSTARATTTRTSRWGRGGDGRPWELGGRCRPWVGASSGTT